MGEVLQHDLGLLPSHLGPVLGLYPDHSFLQHVTGVGNHLWADGAHSVYGWDAGMGIGWCMLRLFLGQCSEESIPIVFVAHAKGVLCACQ
eukprot:6462895-Ditylum_brightwellii.AAC.1